MSTYNREYLLHLPLPLAQLYTTAHNGRQAMIRAEKAFSAFEATVRLAAAVLVSAYRNEVTQGQACDEGIGRLLQKIENPTLEDWVHIVTGLSRYFGSRPDAASHPMGHLWDQLTEPRPDSDGMAELFQTLEVDLGDEPTAPHDFTLLRLLEIVMSFRHDEATKSPEGDETVISGTTDVQLLPALNEMFAPGVVDLLGPEGSRLVWIEEVQATGSGTVEIEGTELVGSHGERIDTITVPADELGRLAPERMAVCWPGRPAPLPLDPLLHFREGDLSVEVLFAARHITDRSVEYTSYADRKLIREDSMAASMALLVADLTGEEASQAPMETLVDVAETAAQFGELLPNQIRVRCLEKPDGDAPSQWILTTDDEVTIGREPANTCALNNPRVSRRHAQLKFTDEGWQYQNLGSNGTLRDGIRSEDFVVSNGDVVQLAASGPRIQFDLPES